MRGTSHLKGNTAGDEGYIRQITEQNELSAVAWGGAANYNKHCKGLGFPLYGTFRVSALQMGGIVTGFPQQQNQKRHDSLRERPEPETKEVVMLRWALAFFVVALVAAVFGFAGIAVAAAGIAKIIFFIFLVLFLVSLVGHLLRRA
jgi:uncharacterized membrane protein YtjA (UPF0391 family)